MDSFGTSAVSGGAALGSRSARMEAIRALNLRLDKTCIEHLDWQRCIEVYDRPETFFFVDPPYTECKASMYAAWTNTDVQILRDRLGRLRGKWLVTMNDAPAVRAIFAGCAIKAVERTKGINTKSKDRVYREIIITPQGA